MSTPSPDPDEGPETSKTPSSGGPADTPAAAAPTAAPPTAELLVTPAAEAPADTTVVEEVEEQAFTPEAAEEPPVTAVATEPAWAQLIRRATLGQAVVIVTGVLLFIWGFLPWYDRGIVSANAWSTVTIPGLVMTATWVPVLSLAIVVFMVIKVFGDGFPDTILGFSWAQLAIMVGLFDFLITLGFLVANVSLGSYGSLAIGAGLVLSFITSLVLLAGGIFDHLGMGTESFSRLRPPQARRDRP